MLTADEVTAYRNHAIASNDKPLLALVEEVAARRAADTRGPWAILVLSAEQLDVIPALVASRSGPVLIVAPDGTTIADLPAGRPLTLETYDTRRPLQLRDILRAHGLGA
jgi:hypothetical protein